MTKYASSNNFAYLRFGFLVRPLIGDEKIPSPADVDPAIFIEYSVSFFNPVIVVVVGEGDWEAI